MKYNKFNFKNSKKLLILPIALIIVACSDNAKINAEKENKVPSQMMKNMDMKSMDKKMEDKIDPTCRQKADGVWMGNCEKPHDDSDTTPNHHDEKSEKSHAHKEGMTDDHGEEKTEKKSAGHHVGNTDVKPHDEPKKDDHDDSNLPPHRD